MKRWVVVANSSYAEIFEWSGKQLKKVDLIDFPEGRLKGSAIVSDRPGRGFERSGLGNRHALSSETDPHLHEQEIFAHKLVDFLKKALNKNEFKDLTFVMPPDFLGLVRLVLPDSLKHL